MRSRQAAEHAIESLEAQLRDLNDIRNATQRDPSFKNWRQATLTVMQRIWPGEQDRFERFRRIPFSPADPRADARAMREWYSRGCQEAARVLAAFIEDIRENGVPELAESLPETQASEFEDGFPTVDLPAGDLGSSTSMSDMTDNMLTDFDDSMPQGSDPLSPMPAKLQISPAPTSNDTASTPPPTDARPVKKGLSMKARLRDLLGFAQLSAKAIAGIPSEPEAVAPPLIDLRAELGVLPLGDEVGPPAVMSPAMMSPPVPPAVVPPSPLTEVAAPRTEWPVLRNPVKPASDTSSVSGAMPIPATTPATVTPPLLKLVPPPVAVKPVAPVAPASPVADSGNAGAAAPPGASDSMSIPSMIMSKPTTLRGSIEKVSIESLISPAFRSTTDEPATPVTPAPPVASEPPANPRPALTLVRPVFNDPEFSAEPPAPPAPAEKRPAARTASVKIVPLPPPPAVPEPEAKFEDEQEFEAESAETPPAKVDPEAFARATEDFMRSSPVLGATGRRVQRGFDDPGFGDADAIAVGSMVADMTRMGIPAERQPEVRARLMDLARRLERGELEWNALRKAVWFVMEYPELARRIMPVLLPWIDRAA